MYCITAVVSCLVSECFCFHSIFVPKCYKCFISFSYFSIYSITCVIEQQQQQQKKLIDITHCNYYIYRAHMSSGIHFLFCRSTIFYYSIDMVQYPNIFMLDYIYIHQIKMQTKDKTGSFT